MKALLEQLGFEHLPMLSEFVLKQAFNNKIPRNAVRNYTDFITQPLTKGMFVPTDEEGNVLEEPQCYGLERDGCNFSRHEAFCSCDQYQQAKERVLFEDIGLYGSNDRMKVFHTMNGNIPYGTIEQAINAGVKFKLK